MVLWLHCSYDSDLRTKKKVFNFLIDCGVCVNGGGYWVFQTPLQHACGLPQPVDLFVKLIIERGADINQQGYFVVNTPLVCCN